MPDCLDLTHNIAVTTALLLDPLAWRVRVVEQIDVDSPISALRRRSLQCAPLRPVIAAAAGLTSERSPGQPESALLVVPVAPIPKGPLLELDIHGPEGTDAFLLKRGAIAAIEAAFVAEEARRAGLELPPPVLALVEAALGFSEAQWQQHRPNLRTYLAEGADVAADDPRLLHWINVSQRVGRVIAPLADVPEPVNSAVENPALVVPALLARGVVSSPDDVAAVLLAYLHVLQAAADAGERARTFLYALTEYGSHYDLMAVIRAPLDEPFLIKVSDRRPLRLSRVVNKGNQSVVLADALSNHLALRVIDPNARLARVKARNAAGDAPAYGTFTSRGTPQVHAAYAFDPDRDYRVQLRFRVALLRRLQLVPYALGLLLFGLAWLIRDADPGIRELALLVGPGSLAASVLLARESSALGSRVRRTSNWWLVTAMAAVVFVATWRYIES